MELKSMDNKKDNSYYFSKVIENIDIIKEHLNNETYEEFINDGKTIDSVMFRMIQLVENIKNITSDFKDSHPEIKWHRIIGFRNGIVHEYDKTDYSIVYEIITINLADLRNLFERCI